MGGSAVHVFWLVSMHQFRSLARQYLPANFCPAHNNDKHNDSVIVLGANVGPSVNLKNCCVYHHCWQKLASKYCLAKSLVLVHRDQSKYVYNWPAHKYLHQNLYPIACISCAPLRFSRILILGDIYPKLDICHQMYRNKQTKKTNNKRKQRHFHHSGPSPL